MPWKLVLKTNLDEEIETYYLTSHSTFNIFDVAGALRPVGGDSAVKSTALARLTTLPWGIKLSAVSCNVGVRPANPRTNHSADPPVEGYQLNAEKPGANVSEIIFLREGDVIMFSSSRTQCLVVKWDDTEVQVNSSTTEQSEIPESAEIPPTEFDSDEVLTSQHRHRLLSKDFRFTRSYVEESYGQHVASTPRASAANASVVTETPAAIRFTTIQDVARRDIYDVPSSSGGTKAPSRPADVAPEEVFSTAPAAPETTPEASPVDEEEQISAESEIQQEIGGTQVTIIDLGSEEADSQEKRHLQAQSPELGNGTLSISHGETHFEQNIVDDAAVGECANRGVSATPGWADNAAEDEPQLGGDPNETEDSEADEGAAIDKNTNKQDSYNAKSDKTLSGKPMRDHSVSHESMEEVIGNETSEDDEDPVRRPGTRSIRKAQSMQSAPHRPKLGKFTSDETSDEVFGRLSSDDSIVDKETIELFVNKKVVSEGKPSTTTPGRVLRGKATSRKGKTKSTTDPEPGLDFTSILSQLAGRPRSAGLFKPASGAQSTRLSPHNIDGEKVQISTGAIKRSSPSGSAHMSTPSGRPTKRTKTHTSPASPSPIDVIAVAPKKTPARRSRRHTDADDQLSSDDEDSFDIAKPRVSFSNSGIPATESFLKFLRSHGGRVVDNISGHWDILCIKPGAIIKSPKLLISVALGIPIVTDNWLIDSTRQGRFLPLKDYIPSSPEQEREWSFKMESIWCEPQNTLLKGKMVFFTPDLATDYSPFSDIQAVCKAAGAKQAKIIRAENEVKGGDDSIVLAHGLDDEFALALNENGQTCFRKDLLTMSILRGHLDLKSAEFHIHPSRSQEKKRGEGQRLRSAMKRKG